MLPQAAESPQEARRVLTAVGTRKWIVLLCGVIGLAMAVVVTSRQSDQYSASSRVLISGRISDQVIDPSTQDNPQQASRQLENELVFIRSDASRDEVAARLGYQPAVTASRAPDSDLLTFKAIGTDPEQVALAANTAAEVYVELRAQRVIDDFLETSSVVEDQLDAVLIERDELVQPVEDFRASLDPAEVSPTGELVHSPAVISAYESELAQLEAGISRDLTRLDATIAALENTLGELELSGRLLEEGTAEVTQAARTPDEPFSPNVLRNLLFGLAFGLTLGLAIALTLEFLDDRVRTRNDIRPATKLPVLGTIPKVRGWQSKGSPPLVSKDDTHSAPSEAYRMLRTSIEFLNIDGDNSCILITSPDPSVGKSATAANLAVALANAGHRVVVVDCDLRKPRLHEYFGIESRVGFTSVLLGKALPEDATQSIDSVPGLHVVASGPVPQFPAELFHGGRTQAIFEDFRSRYDYVLIDSPPVMVVSDPLVLSRFADSVLLVVRARMTTLGALTRSLERLEELDAPVAGIVLNCSREQNSYYSGYTVRETDDETSPAASLEAGTERSGSLAETLQ